MTSIGPWSGADAALGAYVPRDRIRHRHHPQRPPLASAPAIATQPQAPAPRDTSPDADAVAAPAVRRGRCPSSGITPFDAGRWQVALQHERALRRLARALVNDPATADDATQHALLQERVLPRRQFASEGTRRRCGALAADCSAARSDRTSQQGGDGCFANAAIATMTAIVAHASLMAESALPGPSPLQGEATTSTVVHTQNANSNQHSGWRRGPPRKAHSATVPNADATLPPKKTGPHHAWIHGSASGVQILPNHGFAKNPATKPSAGPSSHTTQKRACSRRVRGPSAMLVPGTRKGSGQQLRSSVRGSNVIMPPGGRTAECRWLGGIGDPSTVPDHPGPTATRSAWPSCQSASPTEPREPHHYPGFRPLRRPQHRPRPARPSRMPARAPAARPALHDSEHSIPISPGGDRAGCSCCRSKRTACSISRR